jgi:hypothetical protein
MDRRNFLLTTLSAVGAAGLSACGGGGGSSAEQPTSQRTTAPTASWDVAPVLVAGVPQAIFDLNASLPASVRRGGRFSVSPTGAQLPLGVTLSPAGALSATSDASVGVTEGIIFAYEEPAA